MAANPLTTLANVKTWLGIDTGDTAQDARLNILIAAVSAKIAEYCGCDFAEHVVTSGALEYADGGRADAIMPRYLPIISVEGVYLVGMPGNTTPTALDETSYSVTDNGIFLVQGLFTDQGRASVAIAYHGGYASIPEDVAMAALLSVEAMYLRRTNKSVGIASRSKTVGSGTSETETYSNAWHGDSGLPQAAVGLLQSYKQMEWPSSSSMATRNY